MEEAAFTLLHNGQYTNSWEYIGNNGGGDRKGWHSQDFVASMAYLMGFFQLEGLVADWVDWQSHEKAHIIDVSFLTNEYGP